MAQRVSGYERKPDETYETSATWPVRLIIPYLRQRHCQHSWEPAPADGVNSKLAQTLCAEGLHVTITASDFLKLRELPYCDVDSIATNPPYGENKRGELAQKFIEHALELPVRVVAMLLKADFDSGVTRRHLFDHCPVFALRLTLLSRIVWFQTPGVKPQPSDNHAWFLWDKQHRGPHTIAYAHPCDLEGGA